MKKIALLLALSLGGAFVFAQAIWNKKLPTSSAIYSFSELTYAENSYWVSSDNSLLQINETGNITGRITTGIGFPSFWFWGTKITPSINATPYYLLARLTSLAPVTGYTIAHYSPELGIVNQTIFADSLTPLRKVGGL